MPYGACGRGAITVRVLLSAPFTCRLNLETNLNLSTLPAGGPMPYQRALGDAMTGTPRL
jgi:hypothetical protein